VGDVAQLQALDVCRHIDTGVRSAHISSDYSTITYKCRMASAGCEFHLRLEQRARGKDRDTLTLFDVYSRGRHSHHKARAEAGKSRTSQQKSEVFVDRMVRGNALTDTSSRNGNMKEAGVSGES